MNYSNSRNSSVFSTSNVYWAYALKACNFFPRSGGEGDCITS